MSGRSSIKPLFIVLTLSLFVATPVCADAFEGLGMMRMGKWEVDFSGNVNAFWTKGECRGQGTRSAGKRHLVPGSLACGGWALEPDALELDYGDIRDGFLPSWLNFTAQTLTESGMSVKVHLSFQPGTDTGAQVGSLDSALGQGSTDFRQVFVTMGHKGWGTFKIGRDLGVFGSDAVLEDMTLLGVGGGAFGTFHTALGRTGFGYLYADWKSQLAYTSPSINGFSFTAAIIDPWAAKTITGGRRSDDSRYSLVNGDQATQHEDTYGFEAKVNYDFDTGNDISGRLWAGYARQDVDFESFTVPAGKPLTDFRDETMADAWEIGGKLQLGPADVVAYYYDGEGVGTSYFLFDGHDLLGHERDSDGWYLQGRYRMPVGTMLGLSYGESRLGETSYDREVRIANPIDGDLVKSNELFVIGLYHPVGEALNLVLEYSDSESEGHNGNQGEEETVSIGGIMFF